MAGFATLGRWREAGIEQALIVGILKERRRDVRMASTANLATDEPAGLNGLGRKQWLLRRGRRNYLAEKREAGEKYSDKPWEIQTP